MQASWNHDLNGSAADQQGVIAAEAAEVDVGIFGDPVDLAMRTGDEAIETGGDAVADLTHVALAEIALGPA